jgi:hypothetical protein
MNQDDKKLKYYRLEIEYTNIEEIYIKAETEQEAENKAKQQIEYTGNLNVVGIEDVDEFEYLRNYHER